jgi:hypothetical protein
MEALPEDYRSHGSLHELDVPIYVFNQGGDPPPIDSYTDNLDLTKSLYRD